MSAFLSRRLGLSLAGSLMLVALTAAAGAQSVTTPAPGTADRRAIMDAMRAHGGDQNRVFVVRALRVSQDWAWLDADPKSKDGRNNYESESALLRRTGTGWAVVDQPCAEEGCSLGREVRRIRAANPAAPGVIFPR
jgi:hypothetical protein